MTSSSWTLLRNLLIDRYEDLRARLTRQFGSEDFAEEALHETWLHLHRDSDPGQIQSPSAFVARIAENIARDRLRAERRARRVEIDAALSIPDPTPDAARQRQARQQLEIAARAIAELPERTRTVLVLSRLEGLAHQKIADRLGISRRTVLYELNRAIAHLNVHLDQDTSAVCAQQPRESS